jgi:hypothetical protein
MTGVLRGLDGGERASISSDHSQTCSAIQDASKLSAHAASSTFGTLSGQPYAYLVVATPRAPGLFGSLGAFDERFV